MPSDVSIRRDGFDESDADIVIVIDVLRAFTTSRILMERGAERIRLAKDYDEALELTAAGYLTLGEHKGLKLDGMVGGNSPSFAEEVELDARPLALLTTYGVPAARAAKRVARRAFATGLRGSRFLAAALQDADASNVEIWTSDSRGEDDFACAEFIRGVLVDGAPDFEASARKIAASPTAAKFLDDSQPLFERRDLEIATSTSEMPFVMEVVDDADEIFLIRRTLHET